MKKLTIITTIMAAGLALSVQAQQSQPQQDQSQPGQSGQSSQGAPGTGAESTQGQGSSQQDKQFIEKAAQANLTEVQLGQLGSQ